MPPKVNYVKGQQVGLCIFINHEPDKVYSYGKQSCGKFICRCGKEFTCSISAIKSKSTKSCGCINHKAMLRHGHTSNGKQSPEYVSWHGAKERCVNENSKYYYNYGGRGILMCERWLNSFDNFLLDMGLKPSKKHSIERIINDGNYEPSNCRWATRKEQERNKRSNRILFYNNESMCIAAWSEKLSIKSSIISSRLVKGWSIEKALSTPVYEVGGIKKNTKIIRYEGSDYTINELANKFNMSRDLLYCRLYISKWDVYRSLREGTFIGKNQFISTLK